MRSTRETPRTRRPCGLASIALGATLLACTGVQAAERSDPKIVYLGARDSPRPAQFAAEVGALERANTPIDGTSINFVARYPDGNFAKPFNRAFAGTLEELRVRGPLQRSWFERGAEDIRAANPRYITENFLRLQSRPGSVDWFDDAAWVQIVDTFRHAAFAASEAGLKGIFFDPEPYLEGFAQFEYLLQTGFGTRDYEAYVEQARLRGREVMSAMQEEFPALTILSLFLNAYPVVPRFRSETTADAADPRLSLVRDPYALLPPFVDGWLDVANPDVTFVDGNETAYYYDDPIDFDVAAARIREDGAALVSPGNREKYARQVQVGSAVFLDAYQDAFPEQFRPPLPEGQHVAGAVRAEHAQRAEERGRVRLALRGDRALLDDRGGRERGPSNRSGRRSCRSRSRRCARPAARRASASCRGPPGKSPRDAASERGRSTSRAPPGTRSSPTWPPRAVPSPTSIASPTATSRATCPVGASSTTPTARRRAITRGSRPGTTRRVRSRPTGRAPARASSRSTSRPARCSGSRPTRRGRAGASRVSAWAFAARTAGSSTRVG